MIGKFPFKPTAFLTKSLSQFKTLFWDKTFLNCSGDVYALKGLNACLFLGGLLMEIYSTNPSLPYRARLVPAAIILFWSSGQVRRCIPEELQVLMRLKRRTAPAEGSAEFGDRRISCL